MIKDNVIVRLENFEKSYKDKVVIKHVNLDVYEGEFLTFLGASGCGKTTILRSISGLDHPTNGKVYLDGVDVTDLPPQKRHVNTIFQNYALFPLMTVKENVSFGLKMNGVKGKEIEARVNKMLKLVHLEGYEDRKPNQLSGGEQQRVSIIRGLINNPRVLLLDEPISALDLKLRKKMHVELKQLQRKLGITFIYVTHDQDEALSMSDRIVVLNNGVIEQIGTPSEVYENPKSLFVANFLGEANVFKGQAIYNKDQDEDKTLIKIDDNVSLTVLGNYNEGESLDIIIRPENVKIGRVERKVNCLPAIITDQIYDGSFTKFIIKSFNKSIKAIVFGNNITYKVGDEVFIYWGFDDQVVIGSNRNEKQ